ncbi:MAG: hypothetical protein ACTSSG_00980 [Candidatus Heimdallarchaeaceae archaeon]
MTDTLDTFVKIGEESLIPSFFFLVGSTFVFEGFKAIFIVIIPIALFAKLAGSFTGVMFSTNPIKEFLYVRKLKEAKLAEKRETEEKEKLETVSFWKNIKPNILSSGKIAIGMMPKGEITLIIAAIGLAAVQNYTKFIPLVNELYSVVILLVLVTVFLTPFLLKLAFSSKTKKSES